MGDRCGRTSLLGCKALWSECTSDPASHRTNPPDRTLHTIGARELLGTSIRPRKHQVHQVTPAPVSPCLWPHLIQGLSVLSEDMSEDGPSDSEGEALD